MPIVRSTHVEVYLFRRRGRQIEFLILRRAASRRVLPGVWQPVTGKRRVRETMFRAAVREVREETGFTARRWWALETTTVYPDVERDAIVVVPLFAAEVDARARVALSREHDAARWVRRRDAERRVLWESQRRGFAAVQREVLAGGALAAALEVRAGRVG